MCNKINGICIIPGLRASRGKFCLREFTNKLSNVTDIPTPITKFRNKLKLIIYRIQYNQPASAIIFLFFFTIRTN